MQNTTYWDGFSEYTYTCQRFLERKNLSKHTIACQKSRICPRQLAISERSLWPPKGSSRCHYRISRRPATLKRPESSLRLRFLCLEFPRQDADGHCVLFFFLSFCIIAIHQGSRRYHSVEFCSSLRLKQKRGWAPALRQRTTTPYML